MPGLRIPLARKRDDLLLVHGVGAALHSVSRGMVFEVKRRLFPGAWHDSSRAQPDFGQVAASRYPAFTIQRKVSAKVSRGGLSASPRRASSSVLGISGHKVA